MALADKPPSQSSFRAGLLASAFPAIVIGMIATIGLYLVLLDPDAGGANDASATIPTGNGTAVVEDGQNDRYLALGVGVLIGLVFVVANAYLSQHRTSPDHVNPRQYGELRQRWTTLNADLGLVCPAPAGGEAQQAACISALAHRDYIAAELGIAKDGKKSRGGRWVVGSGFIDLWVRVHQAEASLLILQAPERAVDNGLYDERRLMDQGDQGIKNSDLMLAQLRGAVTVLGGKAYLISASAAEDSGNTDTSPSSEIGARLVLANIRRTINNVRDESRAGLLETRNYLIWTGFFTGLVTYALLALAILMGASRSSIVAGTAFFLVGGLVGLFAQLRSTSTEKVRSGEDDFGLAQARLLYVPVLSGLAGIGGVLVMMMLYPAIGVPLDVDADNSGQAIPVLADIFALRTNGFGLLVAAVFGLTPDLLINRLQGQADEYKKQLAQTGVEIHQPPPK